MNKLNLQTDKALHLVGDFRSFVELLAKNHIAQTFSKGNDTSPEFIASSMISTFGKNPNQISSFHNGNHLDHSEGAFSRLVEIAKRSNDAPYHYNTDDALARANWDFSNEVNRQYSLVMYDYMMTHGFEVEQSKMTDVVARNITDPISLQQSIQNNLPVKLLAAVELKTSLDRTMAAGEGMFERYSTALLDEGMNKSVLDFVASDAERSGVELPDAFSKLRHCVTDIHASIDAEDTLALPDNQKLLDKVFEVEGVDSGFSLVTQSNDYIASISSTKDVEFLEVNNPSLH